jgi:hypothetical protein
MLEIDYPDIIAIDHSPGVEAGVENMMAETGRETGVIGHEVGTVVGVETARHAIEMRLSHQKRYYWMDCCRI